MDKHFKPHYRVSASLAERLARRPKWVSRAVEMALHCAARMVRLRATGMAAELTYRTLFALIPLTVLGLVLFRVVGGLDEVQTRVEDQLFSFFGVPDVSYAELPTDVEQANDANVASETNGVADNPSNEANAEPKSPVQTPQLTAPPVLPGDRVALEEAIDHPTDPEAAQHRARLEQQRVKASIRRTLKELTEKVTGVDFASLGVVGLLLFIYAAVGLTDSVEADFNLVCESEQNRPWHLRMAIHWSILTIGSGLLAMSLYLADRLVDWVAGHGGTGIIQNVLGRVLSFVAGWILLFLMYALMPNTRIHLRASIIGSLIAAILWELAKRLFSVYVSTTQPYANLYGSLGLIPVFFFWVYITWLIMLFGLFLTYSWQAYPGHPPTPEEDRQSASIVPNSLWSLSALVEIGQAFHMGRGIDLPGLTEKLRLPPSIVRHLVERLEECGYVLRSPSSGGERFTLAQPAERIKISNVVGELGETPGATTTETGAGWIAFDRVQKAYQDAAGTLTLADLVQA